MLEVNKAIVRRMIENVWNERDVGAIDRFFAHDFFNHHPVPGLASDRAGLQQAVQMLLDSFPDLYVVIDDLIAERDQVVARMTMRGTHHGALAGIPPTGKRITMIAISILRLQGDQIVERWSMDTSHALLRYLAVE